MWRPINTFTSISGVVGTHLASVSISDTSSHRNVARCSAFSRRISPMNPPLEFLQPDPPFPPAIHQPPGATSVPCPEPETVQSPSRPADNPRHLPTKVKSAEALLHSE